MWDKLTGKHAEQRRQNEIETLKALERDKQQANDLRKAQLDERRKLQVEIQQKRFEATKQQAELHKDLASYSRMQERQNIRVTDNFNTQSRLEKIKSPRRNKGPSLEH